MRTYRKDLMNETCLWRHTMTGRCPRCLRVGTASTESWNVEADGEWRERVACLACGLAWLERRIGGKTFVEGLRDADLP